MAKGNTDNAQTQWALWVNEYLIAENTQKIFPDRNEGKPLAEGFELEAPG